MPSLRLALVAATVLAALTLPDAGSAEAQASITITDEQQARRVPDTIVGGNLRWLFNDVWSWDAAVRDEYLRVSRQAKLGTIRYPGGTVANLFDWRKAVGPDRGCQVGAGFASDLGERVPPTYGVPEHQRYVEEIGATTQIMMPNITTTPRQAANFVEYMNAPVGANPNGGRDWAEVRAGDGHRDPYNISWWELGNEPYLPNQAYWRDNPLEQYIHGGTTRQTDERLGKDCNHINAVSDHTAGQAFQVLYPPVVPDSQSVRVDGVEWTPVKDLANSDADDTHYVFDPETGTATFGNGTHGAIPPDGAVITADYDSGPHASFKEFRAAMREVDDSISVCSAWAKPEFVDAMDSTYDCLGLHAYSTPDKSGTPDEQYDKLMAAAENVVGRLDELQAALEARFNDPPWIGVSEFGTLGSSAGSGFPGYGASMMFAEYLARLTTSFVNHDVRWATNSNLSEANPSPGGMIGGYDEFLLTARAHVLRLYAGLADSVPVVAPVVGNPDATGGQYRALDARDPRGRRRGQPAGDQPRSRGGGPAEGVRRRRNRGAGSHHPRRDRRLLRGVQHLHRSVRRRDDDHQPRRRRSHLHRDLPGPLGHPAHHRDPLDSRGRPGLGSTAMLRHSADFSLLLTRRGGGR